MTFKSSQPLLNLGDNRLKCPHQTPNGWKYFYKCLVVNNNVLILIINVTDLNGIVFVFCFKICCTTNSSLTRTSVTGHGCRRRGRLWQPGGGLWRLQLGGVDLPSRQLVPADRRQTALPRLHAERPGGVVQRAEAAATVARQVGPSRST